MASLQVEQSQLSSLSPPRSVAEVKAAILHHLTYSLGTTRQLATEQDFYTATALAIREPIIDLMQSTEDRYLANNAKRMYYLSMEFLMGRSLENNLRNLGLLEACRQALQDFGLAPHGILDCEPDAALGNGGLGRLAACFLDSLATLDMPGYGYGINYEFGLFRQSIQNGEQRERPDNWLAFGTPWQVERPNEVCVIPVYGNVVEDVDREGNHNPMWVNWHAILGVPHDMPIVGFGARTVNFLRLFSARGSLDFDMDMFNAGDYVTAVEQKIHAETISKVLYPSDAVASGRELRLIQEYFLVACAIRDIVRRFEAHGGQITELDSAVAMQLNDTHPALSVAELMRLLIDERGLAWEQAWNITQKCLAYTNHTLLPEALERWPVSLMQRVLPRHLQLIFEINRRFIDQVQTLWPGDLPRLQRMSIIEEGTEQQVRMCNLAVIGSHSVNGVSAMHSELVKHNLLSDFYELWPERFNNKTNGITPRRWLYQCNPGLSNLISEAIGPDWVRELDQLKQLESVADDASFQDAFASVKLDNKKRLAETIYRDTGVVVDSNSMFDVHIKRIHEYKRQLLNALRIIHDYQTIVDDGQTPRCARTYIFAGKAAPGYWLAKQIIKLINHLGTVINQDERANPWMRVVFLPDYRVSLSERILPASELSEQISTAGYEASGTGNMKFMLNGALTIGTLDGANIEMLEEAGEENFFIFGRSADGIRHLREEGYNPHDYYLANPELRRVLDDLTSNRFSPNEPGLFQCLFDLLVHQGDHYALLADFQSYIEVQQRVSNTYLNSRQWNEKAILNVARSGKFSSDRTIQQYASQIWKIQSFRDTNL